MQVFNAEIPFINLRKHIFEYICMNSRCMQNTFKTLQSNQYSIHVFFANTVPTLAYSSNIFSSRFAVKCLNSFFYQHVNNFIVFFPKNLKTIEANLNNSKVTMVYLALICVLQQHFGEYEYHGQMESNAFAKSNRLIYVLS